MVLMGQCILTKHWHCDNRSHVDTNSGTYACGKSSVPTQTRKKYNYLNGCPAWRHFPSQLPFLQLLKSIYASYFPSKTLVSHQLAIWISPGTSSRFIYYSSRSFILETGLFPNAASRQLPKVAFLYRFYCRQTRALPKQPAPKFMGVWRKTEALKL